MPREADWAATGTNGHFLALHAWIAEERRIRASTLETGLIAERKLLSGAILGLCRALRPRRLNP